MLKLTSFALSAVLPLLAACTDSVSDRAGSGAADTAGTVASPGAANLFVDPGFESGDPTFAPWVISIHADSEAYAVTLDDQIAHSGDRSLRIERVRDEPYAGLAQGFRKRELGGHGRFRLSAWIRGQDVASPVRLHAGFFAYGGVIGEVNSEESLHGSFEWTRMTLDIELPERADRLEAGVTVTGDGTVWIDSLELVALGD